MSTGNIIPSNNIEIKIINNVIFLSLASFKDVNKEASLSI